MQIPRLPTDNLYKFVALTGVAIVFFGLALPARFIIELETQQSAVTSEIELIATEIEIHKQLSEVIETRYGVTIETLHWDDCSSSHDDADAVPCSVLEELVTSVHELKRKQTQSNSAFEKYGTLSHRYFVITMFLLVSTILGILIAVIGFSWWYHRVQKLEDAILQVRSQKT